MQILNFIFILLEVLALFNLIIIVHELGHFWAAKWRGLHVERFGIWFGKPLWERTFGGVKYSLGCIPAGGFVALPQLAPMEALEGQSEVRYADLPKIKAMDKIIVAFAGPLFSFGLAILIACIVWGIGRPVNQTETTTVVGYVDPESPSPAKEAGILAGDKILEIDGSLVTRWVGMGDDSVKWQIVSSTSETIPIKVERDGKVHELIVQPTKEPQGWWQRRKLRMIKIVPYEPAIVADIYPNSPAERAGIQKNDVIEKVNSIQLYSWRGLIGYIQENPDADLTLHLRRNNQPFQVTLRPEIPVYPDDFTGEKQFSIGIRQWGASDITIAHPGPWEQVQTSVMAMVNTFDALFTRKSDIGAQHLSGPIGIMRMYYSMLASEHGWRLALWFSVLLNVNLAILNLLPIPVLDGGHIVMAATEGLFRRPIPYWILNSVQNLCALLIIGYMLYITFFDVQDLRTRQAPKIYFAAPEDKASPAMEPAHSP